MKVGNNLCMVMSASLTGIAAQGIIGPHLGHHHFRGGLGGIDGRGVLIVALVIAVGFSFFMKETYPRS